MDKKYKIKEYNSLLYKNTEVNELLEEYITKCCLNIANCAQFPTDYDDVREHIFGKDNYLKLFIIEDSNKVIPDIKGFLICDTFYGYNDMKFLHCHGIILSPDVQGLGLSKQIVNHAIILTNPDVVTAKTHNPRCFNSLINIDGAMAYYPNEKNYLPKQILDLARSNPFIEQVDDELIFKGAYPDEKIQQSKRNEKINLIFDRVSLYDAQAIVVVLNDEKLNTKEKTLKYENK